MSNPVSVSDLEKALDALILEDAPPMLGETDITINMISQRAKCGSRKAENLLDEWTAAGKAEYIGFRRALRGHKVKAWRLITK